MHDQNLFDRLIARTVLDPETGCRLWQGQTDGKEDPYGHTTVNGQTVKVHRAMFKSVKGKIRKGRDVDHKCTRRLCIEFDHLQEATPLKNQRLRVKRAKHKHNVFKCLAIK